jgi:hypothetical protein
MEIDQVMDEDTRVVRYEKQNDGRPETPAQRRRRMHKRGHQMRAANLRRARVRDIYLPESSGGLVFKPYKIVHTGSRGAVKISPADKD